MGNSLSFFTLALPISYLAATAAYSLNFFSTTASFKQLTRPALLAVTLLHCAYLLVMTFHQTFPPIASLHQIMSMIAFTLLTTYLFIELTTDEVSTGAFVLFAAFLFQLCSSAFIAETHTLDTSFKNPILATHILAALLGYSAIAVAGVYSLLYIMMLRQIQTNKFGTLFERLPNLETLETMSLRAVGFGFTFLTVAFISGAAWIPQSDGRFTFGDPKLIGLTMVWVIYGASLLLRQRLGLQGKRMAVTLAAGFLFSFLSMTAMNFFSSRFHAIQ